ncbi:MAG: hypothetical protein AAF585_12245 [Verrucomicrobiota bacterium]
MVPSHTSCLLAMGAFLALSAAAIADDYAGVYSSSQTVAPPKNLRITKGLPPMTELTGQIVRVDSATRVITVRDRANQLHKFRVPAFSTLTANANLHQNGAALRACLNRNVRVRFIDNIPEPDRSTAIDIFPAG